MEIGWIYDRLEQFCSIFWKKGKMSEIYYSNWEYLPDLVILEIYKYLDDKEKIQMSLTCKRWGSLFNSACLWRVRHFDMSGYKSHSTGMKANMFLQQHGAHVRYLTISCGHLSYQITKIFQTSFENLLSSQLRHSQLAEIEIDRLELDRFWRQQASRERFINYFVRFFEQQKRLKIFDMTSAQFSVNGGIRILDTVGSRCGSIMEELFIEDFFPSRRALFEIEKFKRALAHFSNLNYLAINYNCLSDSVLEILATNSVGLLRTMHIKVYKNDPHSHRISGQTWKQMVTCCPALSVTFWFDAVGHWSEIMPILKREIPVTDIHLWTGYDDDGDHWGLTGTINHIAECYRNSIESVSLEFDNKRENVDDAIIRLVGTCKELRDVSINGQISVATIQSILQQEEENKIHLHSLNITACGLTDVEWAETLLLKENYANLITGRGLHLTITTDIVFDIFNQGLEDDA